MSDPESLSSRATRKEAGTRNGIADRTRQTHRDHEALLGHGKAIQAKGSAPGENPGMRRPWFKPVLPESAFHKTLDAGGLGEAQETAGWNQTLEAPKSQAKLRLGTL